MATVPVRQHDLHRRSGIAVCLRRHLWLPAPSAGIRSRSATFGIILAIRRKPSAPGLRRQASTTASGPKQVDFRQHAGPAVRHPPRSLFGRQGFRFFFFREGRARPVARCRDVFPGRGPSAALSRARLFESARPGGPLQAASRTLLIRLAPKDRIAPIFRTVSRPDRKKSPSFIRAAVDRRDHRGYGRARKRAWRRLVVFFPSLGLALLVRVRGKRPSSRRTQGPITPGFL